ncbi:hypothetical protein C8N46_103461 [Kordia periserrulae]|uniref:Uncharacterized protein n=1 Tax=Kordia periserrulae TaxID=701523 RepID=A0A2T6C217_9FLAO|nr:hypothetical protein [Kordia periserrulae]PTX62361.1 hypothetical protein C8N46_103461 [Kordia periserrulae]
MKKELLLLVGILLAAFLLTATLFGFENLLPNATFNINIYDTYFVFPSRYALIGFMILLITAAYFVRILFARFQIQFANIAFLVFNIMLLICFVLTLDLLAEFEEVVREKMAKTTSQKMSSSSNKVVANLIESVYFMIALAVFVKLLVIFKMRNAQNRNR